MRNPSRRLLSASNQQSFGSLPHTRRIYSSFVPAPVSCFFERPKQHQASIPQHDGHTKHTRRCLSSRGIPSNFTRKQLTSQTALFNNSIGLTEMLPFAEVSAPIQTINSHFSTKKPQSPRKMIPRKAALHLTPKARETFRKLIAATESEGIMLKYEISSQHALRMAFKFDLIKDAKKELTADDEGVSLEVLEDGITPKPPAESWNDNLPKLYIHHGAFMKVLGGTLDVELNSETGELKPKLFDRNGHEMDPNA